MRKLFSLFVLSLCLIGLTLSVAGCGKPKFDENSITMWHWMVDRNDAFEELARQYEEETGIKIKVDLFAPSDAFNQRIIASAQARTLPDIYAILDKKEVMADFIESGFIADLSADFKADNGAWEKAIFEKALDANRFKEGNVYGAKPGIYGVPIDVTNIQMIYNKDLLLKAGFKNPPRNFKEFLKITKALNRVGIAGLVSGWGEIWLVDCLASNYAFNIMGEQKIMDTYQGKVPYTDPAWIKVFKVFQDLEKNKALIEGIVTKPNKDAEQDFALGRAAFAFNGSWSVNVYHDMNPDLNYGVMLPPPVNTSKPMSIWGGAGSSFVVSDTTPNKDKAVAFLKWFTAKKQQVYLAETTRNLPSNREALSEIPSELAEYASGMDNTTHPTIWKYNELPVVTEAFDKGLQSIIIGEKTPEQVAKEVQAIKEREIAKSDRRK